LYQINSRDIYSIINKLVSFGIISGILKNDFENILDIIFEILFIEFVRKNIHPNVMVLNKIKQFKILFFKILTDLEGK
jgi:hypothetical protein